MGPRGGVVLAQGHKTQKGRTGVQAPAVEAPKPVALNQPLKIQSNEEDKLRESLILHSICSDLCCFLSSRGPWVVQGQEILLRGPQVRLGPDLLQLSPAALAFPECKWVHTLFLILFITKDSHAFRNVLQSRVLPTNDSRPSLTKSSIPTGY